MTTLADVIAKLAAGLEAVGMCELNTAQIQVLLAALADRDAGDNP